LGTLGEDTVRTTLSIVVVMTLSASLFASTAAGQVRPASTTAAGSVDEIIKAVRADLQGNRAEIIAKNVTLDSAQAAKFWPVFNQYQQEQNVIMEDQMRGLQEYVDRYERLDDAGALGLITAHLERDAKMTMLRQKWLGEFQKVLPTKLAVLVMQIDRRISLVHQLEFASKIPLVH
jgi:Spy/CpxP family protein refolding chaperone